MDITVAVMIHIIFCNIILLHHVAESYVDHRGVSFVTGFLNLETTYGPELLLIPQVTHPVNVSIRTESQSGSEPLHLTLPLGNSHVVTMPSNIRMKPGIVEMKGIKITATDEIAVYSINKSPHSKDAILVLPSDALGTDYVIPSYKPGANYVTSIGVVSTMDKTMIKIALHNINKSVRVQFENVTYDKGEHFTIQLQEFETIQLQSESDLSGLKITSNKSIAIIIGSSRKDTQNNGGDLEHTEEQVIPSNAWGTAFIALPFSGNNTPDMFKISSSCDNTSVQIKTADMDSSIYNLETGESVQVELNNTRKNAYISISSNKPISVLQYYCSSKYYSIKDSSSSSSSATKCDSFLVTIPPLEQQEEEYVYSTWSNSSTQTHAVTLVINSTLSEGLLIDDKPSGLYQDNDTYISLAIDGYDTNFTAMMLHIPSGYHNISHTNRGTPFSAISHANPIGMRMVDLRLTANNTNDGGAANYNVEPKQEIISKDTNNIIQLMETTSSDDGSGSLPANVIAVIVTLTSAIFFVIVCILGFVLTETVCRRESNKISPFQVY